MSTSQTAALIFVVSLGTILGAYVFEYGFRILPCPLCLTQRIPYYATIPLAVIAYYLSVVSPGFSRIIFALIALIMLISAGLGAYHSGVEWGFWPGPTSCTGEFDASAITNPLEAMREAEVIRCDEAAWRLFGISLAGWNVLISLGLAFIAARAAYGSSSTSQ